MFEFIADRPVLDFVATVSERRTTRVERLRSADDLAAWVAGSGLVDGPLQLGVPDLERARALREALFDLISALLDGGSPDPGQLALVNAAAAAEPPRLRLDPDGRLHRTGELDAVLAALARDGLDLVDSPDRAALHWCADATCTRPFVDRSRGHRRRWCGMRGCGDRAKAAAYRRRRSGQAQLSR